MRIHTHFGASYLSISITDFRLLVFFCVICATTNKGFTEPVRILSPELLRVGNQWVYQLHLTLDGNEPVDVMAVLTDTTTGTGAIAGINTTIRERRTTIPGIGLVVRTNHFFIDALSHWSGAQYEDVELIETVRANDPTEFLPLVIDTLDSNRQVGSGLYHGQYKPASGEVGSYDGIENTFVTYVRTETITVPAGTFACAVIDFRLEWNDGDTGQDETRYWLNPTIGIIKAEVTEIDFSENERSEFSLELQSTNVQAGSALVSIAPQEVVDAGAQWKIEDVPAGLDFGFMNHNVSLNDIPPGDYRLSFKDITGWIAPAPREITLVGGNQANEVGTYTKIIDSIAPSINVAPEAITLSVDSVIPSFLDGVTATDNIDGDVTSNVMVTGNIDTAVPSEYIITYNVADSAGNQAATKTRAYTVVDDIAPVVIVAATSVSVAIGSAAPDLLSGVKASDNIDGDVTGDITATGNVETDTPGNYIINYGVDDEAGNHAVTVTRTYSVRNHPPTINGVGSIAIPKNATAQTISLSGIMDGDDENQSLSVIAMSNDPGIVPDPTVVYTSPDTIGSLMVTPVTDAVGSAVITVTVTDAGGVANNGTDSVTLSFHVSVAPIVALPAEVKMPFSFRRGWNFVSMPMLPSDYDMETFFQGRAIGNMWTRSSGTWQKVCSTVDPANTQPCQTVELSSPDDVCETICPGKSYWVYLSEDVTTVYTFTTANSLSLGAPALYRAGRNMYGVQSPIPIPSEALGSVWSYTDGRFAVNSVSHDLIPGVGYWINLDATVGLPIGSLLTDTDSDTIADFWEQLWGFQYDSDLDQQADPDNDSRNNLNEFNTGTNPRISDTDGM